MHRKVATYKLKWHAEQNVLYHMREHRDIVSEAGILSNRFIEIETTYYYSVGHQQGRVWPPEVFKTGFYMGTFRAQYDRLYFLTQFFLKTKTQS